MNEYTCYTKQGKWNFYAEGLKDAVRAATFYCWRDGEDCSCQLEQRASLLGPMPSAAELGRRNSTASSLPTVTPSGSASSTRTAGFRQSELRRLSFKSRHLFAVFYSYCNFVFRVQMVGSPRLTASGDDTNLITLSEGRPISFQVRASLAESSLRFTFG